MEPKTTQQKYLVNALLIIGGVAFSGVLIFFILSLFPQFRPDTIVFSVKMGDIFYNHAEWVKRPENPDEVLSIHRLVWDEDGFRMPANPSETYEVIALGDSYTESANVGLPWPDVLAQASGLAVRNLGFRGYGPVEETYILERFGNSPEVRVVVVGFFEGNDLDNVMTSQGKPVTLPSEVEEFEIIPTDLDTVDQSNTRYPMTVDLNGTQFPVAFFEWYVWNLNAAPDVVENSQNLILFRTELEKLQAAAADECLVFAYFPSKPHIYVPYLVEESQSVLMANSHQRELTDDGALTTRQVTDVTFAELTTRLDNQRDAVREVVEDLGILFFDATPLLKVAADRGEMLYYTYDTHWNQAGHTLVGEALAEYLASGVCNQD